MADYPHQHINIPSKAERLRFNGKGRDKFDVRKLGRKEHAARLLKDIRKIEKHFEAELEKRKAENLPHDFGLILNVESAPDFPLKFESLEKKATRDKDGIYLLNVRQINTEKGTITCATILVPYGQLTILEKKILDYSDPEKDNYNLKKDEKNPRNEKLLANINSIGEGALEALWTDPEPLPETDEALWWEMWISRAPRAEKKDETWIQIFERKSEALGLKLNNFRLKLPDNEIVLLKAKRSQLESSLELLNTITEVRKVRPCSIGLTDLSGPEQYEWVDEALTRIVWPDQDAPAVCILDTGVNREHPLLENVLSNDDLDTVIPEFGKADHPDQRDAHGTPMAGLAAYDDLRNLMLQTGEWKQLHRLESVKLIHDGNEHDPIHYGAVTKEAINRPEVSKPNRKRVYCLAITQVGNKDLGQPSSWSAAIDSSAAASTEEEEAKRIIFISAGNHNNFLDYTYIESNKNSSIENPAQAWNGITVGAMTRMVTITESDNESINSRAVGRHEELSPFTRTSTKWGSKWPIKPDIVMEGGNIAQSSLGNYIEKNSLELISTSSKFNQRPLCNMNATSAATAIASRLGAELIANYPDYWPETYRGLMVHSARWSEGMLGQLDPHKPGMTKQVEEKLRLYGFGEPNRERLYGSGESGVTMIIQDTIQPYDPVSSKNNIKLGEFNLHTLPWPNQVFYDHPDIKFKLRVTLSYYIDPNPGSRCWVKSSKYRYASHLLRFDIKRADEDEKTFRKYLEKVSSEEEQEDSNPENNTQDIDKRPPADNKWALGHKLRGKSGSIVHDIWEGSPAELGEMGQVVVYPAKGWFATRSFPEGHEFHDCHKKIVRYSLLISIDAEQEIGLFSSVSNLISINA